MGGGLGFLLLNYFDRLFGCLGNCFLKGKLVWSSGCCLGKQGFVGSLCVRVVAVGANEDLWGVDVSDCLPLRQTRICGELMYPNVCR